MELDIYIASEITKAKIKVDSPIIPRQKNRKRGANYF